LVIQCIKQDQILRYNPDTFLLSFAATMHKCSTKNNKFSGFFKNPQKNSTLLFHAVPAQPLTEVAKNYKQQNELEIMT